MATSNILLRIIGKDDASAEFLRVAAAAKLTQDAVDGLGQNVLGLTKLIGGAGLIPVVAGATAAVAELGTSLAAAGGAASVFGLSAGGFLKQMVAQQQGIASTQKTLDGLTKGTSTYATELKKLHTQQATFNQDFGAAAKGYDNMHAAFGSFMQDTGPVTKGVLAKGFNLVASVLPKLVPVSNAAGKAIGGLLDDLRNWTKGPEFNAVLNWLKTSGPTAITAFGHSIGNVVEGLGKIFANFVGPGDKAAQTLETLTARFDAWAGTKGVSQSVQGFLNYVSQNGPAITTTLRSLAEAAPKIAIALGQIGSTNLTAISMFLNLVAGLPQGLFNVLAKGIFAVVVTLKLLMIAQKVAVLLKAVGVAMGLLDAEMDANPIGLVVLAIAALAAGLIYAYKHSETFRNICNAAFHGVEVAVQALGRVAIWLWNNAFQPSLHFIISALSVLLNMWGHMLTALGHVPGFGWATDAGKALEWAAGKAQALADNINKIPTHKTSTVDMVINTIHNSVHTTGGHAVPGMASGGTVSRAGLSWVGENGPELLSLPRGAQVTPLDRAGVAGGNIFVTVNASNLVDADATAAKIQTALVRLKRQRGGTSLGLA